MGQQDSEMNPVERFLDELAEAIIFAGGTARFGPENARTLSREVWQELMEIGSDAYPVIVQRDDVRFVYQWDQEPALLTVMTWDERMWRDMVRLEVPAELNA